MVVINWLVNNILMQTSIFIGLIAALGLIVQKKTAPEVLEGFLLTAVGNIMFNSGTGILVGAIANVNQILLPTVSTNFGVYPFGDAIMAFSYTVEYIGTNIMQVFIIAWVIHIFVVRIFKKWFKCVFMTVHMMLNMVACCMLFFHAFLGYTGVKVYVPTIIICVIYWTVSPMLVYKQTQEMTGGTFALGHLQQIGAWLGGIVASKVGDPEKDDADNLQLPGWLSMFQSVMLNLSVSMPIAFIIIGIICQLVGNATAMETMHQLTGGTNFYIWLVIQGFTFAAGVAVLQYGLGVFLGSMIPAFQGFTEKIMPGAVPAIDCVAFFSFSPMGVILGFVSYAVAGVLVAIGCMVLKTPVFVFPSIQLAFFDGGSVGVFANKRGGWKGALLAGFLCGLVMHIGGGLLAPMMGPAAEQGMTFGNFDTNFFNVIIFYIIRFFKGI